MALDVDLADRIRELLDPDLAVREQRMFGGLAFVVDGHMAVAASREGGILVRVDPDEQPQLAKRAHVDPFVMRQREMRGWLRVHADGVRTKRQLAPWVQRGVSYVLSLPPK